MASAEQTAEAVAHEYFHAIRHGDASPQRTFYADDATVDLQGVLEGASREDLIAYFEELWGALPDFHFEVLDITAQGDVASARWRLRGTFAGPGTLQGFAPTGERLDVRGVDVVRVADGRIVHNDVFVDNMLVARQLGLLPPVESPTQQRMTAALNLRTKVQRALGGHGPEQVAEGVWRVQGEPAKCNVYLLRDGDGVLMFDAGARTMRRAVATAAAQLGGLTRIVLGHGHTDHRGTAPSFDVPVLCHPDEVADAEGSGGWRYWDTELSFLPQPHRAVHRQFHRRFWDGGPVGISDTVAEGDDVAGFQVVHLPGHAPGLIALWRESDRLALTSDVFYTLDLFGRDVEPRLPIEGYNLDTDQARASLRRLAELEPAAAWPGHAEPVTGDVRAQLEQAAGG